MIRMALGKLQDDPENEAAWNELSEAVTSPGVSNDDVERLLGRARARHEQRREWDLVARILELEISFAGGTSPSKGRCKTELARVLYEELIDTERAMQRLRAHLLQLHDDDAAALSEAIESVTTPVKKTKCGAELVARYLSEAESGDDGFKSSLFTSAADIAFRYGGDAARPDVVKHVTRALVLDPKNRRAANLAETVYRKTGDFEGVAKIQPHVLENATDKAERIAAGLRPRPHASRRSSATPRARRRGLIRPCSICSPANLDGASRSSPDAYSQTEQWDHLVALYEDSAFEGRRREGRRGARHPRPNRDGALAHAEAIRPPPSRTSTR